MNHPPASPSTFLLTLLMVLTAAAVGGRTGMALGLSAAVAATLFTHRFSTKMIPLSTKEKR